MYECMYVHSYDTGTGVVRLCVRHIVFCWGLGRMRATRRGPVPTLCRGTVLLPSYLIPYTSPRHATGTAPEVIAPRLLESDLHTRTTAPQPSSSSSTSAATAAAVSLYSSIYTTYKVLSSHKYTRIIYYIFNHICATRTHRHTVYVCRFVHLKTVQ